MSARAERVAARMRKKAAWTDRVCGDGAGKLWSSLADLVEAGEKCRLLLKVSQAQPVWSVAEWDGKLAALAKALGVEGE